MKKIFAAVFAVFILAACTISEEDSAENQEGLMNCSAYEGADMCTMQYDPVCAKLKNGEWKTFGNACTACISGEVAGYTEGECK